MQVRNLWSTSKRLKAGGRVSEAHKGYSIWSLMVLTTLLAVVLAMPKRVLDSSWPGAIRALYVGCHQVAIWVLVGTLIWMLLGKRRIVLGIEIVVVLIVWGPLFLAVAENLSGSHKNAILRGALEPFGLFDAYGKFYEWMFQAFGYGPF